ncbi:MAG: GNAT family N-acetyltransferase [Patescibacteria group bacterium]|nr:GNAT family N-acetyltransferase [Patescibacteria group bacterium]
MKLNIEEVKAYSEEIKGAINGLLRQLDDGVPSLLEKQVKEIIGFSNSRLFIIKAETGGIVGMAFLIIYYVPTGKKGIIENVVIDENYRGKGLGTRLMNAVIDKARDEKITYVDLTSRPERKSANRLYQRLGFVKRNTNIYRLKL